MNTVSTSSTTPIAGTGGETTTKVKKVKKVVKKGSSSNMSQMAATGGITTETTTYTTYKSGNNNDNDNTGRDESEKDKCKGVRFDLKVEGGEDQETSNANSTTFYEEKMFCHQCDDSLAGHRYVLRDDHPYCIKCYENVFANNCDECGKIIGIESKDLSYKEKHWHEDCFVCSKCRTSLVDKQFGSKADRIYCGPCYDAQFATRCDGCGDVFRAGMKKMEYKTRQWHEKCFVCCTCKNPIGTKSFT